MKIDLFFTPAEVNENELTDKTAVVVDVLRASTTVTWALHNGAREIIPVATIDAASELKSKLGKDHVLLAGERDGLKIEGFDLGNSPAEYEPKIVKEKIVVYCSTNGSKAMLKAGAAALGLIGGFINLSSILKRVLEADKDVALICSGTAGKFSLEDAIFGGRVVEDFQKRTRHLQLNDAAEAALTLYRQYGDDLVRALQSSTHGKYLISLGFEQDLRLAAALNSISLIPVHQGGRYVPLTDELMAKALNLEVKSPAATQPAPSVLAAD